MGRDKEESDIKFALFQECTEKIKQANNELLNETAKKIIESQREFLGKAKDWFKIADEDYVQLR